MTFLLTNCCKRACSWPRAGSKLFCRSRPLSNTRPFKATVPSKDRPFLTHEAPLLGDL